MMPKTMWLYYSSCKMMNEKKMERFTINFEDITDEKT